MNTRDKIILDLQSEKMELTMKIDKLLQGYEHIITVEQNFCLEQFGDADKAEKSPYVKLARKMLEES